MFCFHVSKLQKSYEFDVLTFGLCFSGNSSTSQGKAYTGWASAELKCDYEQWSEICSCKALRGRGRKAANGTSRIISLAGPNGSHSMLNANCDGKGTYLIFNVGDTLFISDLNSQDKVIGCHWGCIFGSLD